MLSVAAVLYLHEQTLLRWWSQSICFMQSEAHLLFDITTLLASIFRQYVHSMLHHTTTSDQPVHLRVSQACPQISCCLLVLQSTYWGTPNFYQCSLLERSLTKTSQRWTHDNASIYLNIVSKDFKAALGRFWMCIMFGNLSWISMNTEVLCVWTCFVIVLHH